MSFPIVLALCFFQFPGGMNSPEQVQRQALAWQARHMAESAEPRPAAATTEAVYEEQQFVNRFNHLLGVLREFVDQYNTRHAVDLKKVKAVKKAWRDLEKSDAWFKLDEDSGR